MRPKNKQTHWTKFFLGFFDFNKNRQVDWWEYVIPVAALVVLDIITGVIANLITNLL